jgi:hypothetical protein
LDLLFIKGAEVGEPSRRAPDWRGIDGMARSVWNAAYSLCGVRLFIDALDNFFDPATDRAILLRPKHRNLARPHLRRHRWRAVFLEALYAFLNALQTIERTLQAILCRAADGGARWFFTAREFCIEGTAHDAGISGFRVT